MAIKPPEFDPNRTSPTLVSIVFNGRGDRVAHLQRALQHNTSFSDLDTADSDIYNDTVDADKNYKYKARYEELELSVEITDDYSTETPPYYVATPLTGVDFTTTEQEITIPWMSNINIDIIDVDPLRLGPASISKYTKGT